MRLYMYTVCVIEENFTSSVKDLHNIICVWSFFRMDSTLVNFSEMKWERGDISFLFFGEQKHQKHSLYVLDNRFRVYQKLRIQVLSVSAVIYVAVLSLSLSRPMRAPGL